VRSAYVVLAASLLALLAGVSPAFAQTPTLTFSLFERYLDSLREQAGIPGISFAVIQNGREGIGALGKQDVESNVAATPDTPYNIAGLSQTFGAAMLLRSCLENDSLQLDDRVVRWVPQYPDEAVTIAQLLTHTVTGRFSYDLDRFAALTDVIVECDDVPYGQTLTSTIFERLRMASSAPGAAFGSGSSSAGTFTESTMTRFADVVRRTAPAYRVDRGRAIRVDASPAPLSAATGVISSVTDLVLFNRALETGSILSLSDVEASWTQARVQGVPVPTGLGWFVQNYMANGSSNGEPLIWQFGQVRDGHSALIMKLPTRGLTFIALANSDGLTAPYNLQNGDVKASPFAALFLKFFLP
jgi:CubicO group peptidase (beta-lactamase class C family)